jgi:hypothetical protein
MMSHHKDSEDQSATNGNADEPALFDSDAYPFDLAAYNISVSAVAYTFGLHTSVKSANFDATTSQSDEKGIATANAAETTIDPLTVAELSAAAYTPISNYQSGITQTTEYVDNGNTLSLPVGWSVNVSLSGINGADQFLTLVNNSTQQVVIAFKGTNNVSDGVSDIANDGSSAYLSLQKVAAGMLANIKSTYAGYQIVTDGHSLGGGMAQTFAVEYGLNGYGQNSLPIAAGSVEDYNDNPSNYNNSTGINFNTALSTWQVTHTFSEQNTAGDPATLYYQVLNNGLYLDADPTQLSNPYLVGQISGASLAELNSVIGLSVAGYYSFEAHSIDTVISDDESSGSASVGAAQFLDLTSADESQIAVAAQDTTPILEQGNLAGVTEGNGIPFTFNSTETTNSSGDTVQNISLATSTETGAENISDTITYQLLAEDFGIPEEENQVLTETSGNADGSISFEMAAGTVFAFNMVIQGVSIMGNNLTTADLTLGPDGSIQLTDFDNASLNYPGDPGETAIANADGSLSLVRNQADGTSQPIITYTPGQITGDEIGDFYYDELSNGVIGFSIFDGPSDDSLLSETISILANGSFDTASFATAPPDVIFSGANGTLMVDSAFSSVHGILNFQEGDTIDLVGLQSEVDTLNGEQGSPTNSYSQQVTLSGGNLDIEILDTRTTTTTDSNGNITTSTTTTVAESNSIAMTPYLGYAPTVISTASDGSGGIDVFTSDEPPCFLSGTRILTVSGNEPIEKLKIGDVVGTWRGQFVPIRWIGYRTVTSRFGDPMRIWPIRIKAGSLDEGAPSRDLVLSPDHAILINDILIQAGALVNGTSIIRETNVPETFTYYHIELDEHVLILAEGTPAETFVDNVDRIRFDNWSDYAALYPNGKSIEEMRYPRAKSHRQVPQAVRSILAARAIFFNDNVERVAA